jgi:hypothetical protein
MSQMAGTSRRTPLPGDEPEALSPLQVLRQLQREQTDEGELDAALYRLGYIRPPPPPESELDSGQASPARTPPVPAPAPAPVVIQTGGKEHFKLPTFSGDSSADNAYAPEFIERFEAYCDAMNVAPRQQIQYLRQAFPVKSTASAWLRSVTYGSVTPLADFAAVKAAFLARYALTRADRAKLSASFRTFTQRGTDNVNKFHANFSTMRLTLTNAGEPYSEAVCLELFEEGLRPALRDVYRQINASRPVTDLNAARILASELERTLPRSQRPAPSLNQAQLPPKTTRPPRNQPPAKESSSSRRPACGFCKKYGHDFDDCSKVKALKEQGRWEDRSRRDPPRSEPPASASS